MCELLDLKKVVLQELKELRELHMKHFTYLREKPMTFFLSGANRQAYQHDLQDCLKKLNELNDRIYTKKSEIEAMEKPASLKQR